MWVVYDKPRDYPTQFVARKWVIEEEGRPTPDVLTAPTLAALRAKLPPLLTMIPRATHDDPNIVEVWL